VVDLPSSKTVKFSFESKLNSLNRNSNFKTLNGKSYRVFLHLFLAGFCYTDFKLVIGTLINLTPNVQTPSGCHFLCMLNMACSAFSFHKIYEECSIFTSEPRSSPNSSFVSGPKFCVKPVSKLIQVQSYIYQM
jgi:hypothetical protein